MKDLLNISLPLTGSRLYHCFMNFLEPILLIHVLTQLGLTQNYIQDQYAILSGYVVSLLVTPTFFCTIIYRLYLPIATDDLYYHKSTAFLHLLYAITYLSSYWSSFYFNFLFFSKTISYGSLQYHERLSTIKIHGFSFFALLFTNAPFNYSTS